MQPVCVVHLSSAHLSDRLFPGQLAAVLRMAVDPCAIVLTHGSDRAPAESMRHDAHNSPPDEFVDVRATVEANRRLAAALTEEGIPCVSHHGNQMGLFSQDKAGNPVCRIPATLERTFIPGVAAIVSLLAVGDNEGALLIDPAAGLKSFVSELGKRYSITLTILTTTESTVNDVHIIPLSDQVETGIQRDLRPVSVRVAKLAALPGILAGMSETQRDD